MVVIEQMKLMTKFKESEEVAKKYLKEEHHRASQRKQL